MMGMDNIKKTVQENLIKLRKEKKLTQLELAEKINYSDKAISRWEKGEVTPDIETLEKLSKIYNVPFACFFEENERRFHAFRIRRFEMGNKLAISLLAILCVWFVAILTYVYLKTILDADYWILFVWAVPISAAIAIIFNSIWGKLRQTFIYVSLLIWSGLAAVFLQLLTQYSVDVWLIFILGIPMQIGTILFAAIAPSRKNKSSISEN